MKKIIYTLVFSIFCLVFSLSVFANASQTSSKKASYTLLFAGLDITANNTDSVGLINANINTGKITMIQIPRDTYCNIGAEPNKINGILPLEISRGASPNAAMAVFKEFVANQFGMHLDGFIAISGETFVKLLDAIGGVYVHSEKELTLTSDDNTVLLKLNAGENHLTATEALTLVRHRSSYKRGDLDRLEAQQLFFKGLHYTITTRLGRVRILSLLSALGEVVTDMKISEIIDLYSKLAKKKNTELFIERIPGEAAISSNGTSYFVLNRAKTIALLESVFFGNYGNFDKNNLFLNKTEEKFSNIYYGKVKK